MKRFFLKGVCSNDRNQAISAIRDAVNHFGFIIDYKRFSDVSISMCIEIEKRKIYSLHQKLKEFMRVEDIDEVESNSKVECLVLLNVTFTKSTGDMKIDAPAIPG